MPNDDNEPHAKRRGWLKNGNPPGDPSRAPRCGAKNRAHNACRAPAMRNGRCRMHGGRSTGPKTAEGHKKSQSANLIHGEYSAQAKEQKRRFVTALREFRVWAKLNRIRKPHRI